jgi:hypothetical protein
MEVEDKTKTQWLWSASELCRELPGIRLEGLGKKNLIQDRHYHERDLNRLPPRYMSRALSLHRPG